MRLILALIFSLFFFNTSFADEQRLTTLFKSANKLFSLQYSKKKWQLKDSSGKVKYMIADHGYTSMTIFISNDGQRLVVIDDFIEANIIGNLPVLTFFTNGKQNISYKLTDIVKDTCNVSKSVWHTMWTLDDFGFKEMDSRFSIATFEFNELEFNTVTGKIITNNKPASFDENTSIVIGNFYKGDGDQVVMTIKKYIAGATQPNNQILFIAKTYGRGSWFESLMIKNGVDITPIRFRVRMHPNRCFIN